MMDSERVWAARKSAVASGLGHVTSVVCDRAMNAELWDLEGKRYIDFAAGIGVVNTGHNHPRIKAAVLAQLERFTHVSINVALYPQYIALAERLNALVPGETLKKTFLVSTGAEAVENAVKIARAATGRSALIAFSAAFHGRTMMTMALTGKVKPYKAGFGPMPGEVYHAPFPNLRAEIGVDAALGAIERLFQCDVEPARVAAIIIEPVQGEGGFNIAPPEFLRGLRALCDVHGILLIVDEIQSGFGRTGRMFAHEHAGIEADLVTMAKGIAGGYPLAAVTGRAKIMDAPAAGGLGGTYGGSPVACAAALAVLDVMIDEALPERAEKIGALIAERLEALGERTTAIGDVRRLGGMVAMELVRGDGSPNPDLARALIDKAQEFGLILLSCGTDANVIRFLPALTIEWDQLEEGMTILVRALEAVGAIGTPATSQSASAA